MYRLCKYFHDMRSYGGTNESQSWPNREHNKYYKEKLVDTTVKVILLVLAAIAAIWVISLIGGYIIKFAFGLAAIAAVYFIVKYYMSKEAKDESKPR